jgi:Cu/Zn superoxide dismutase
MRHAGDFGDLTFDKDGNASSAMETDSVTLEPGGADSVVGRAVVVYSRKDNKQGKAGSPIACGVVVLEGQSPETRSSYAVPAAPSPAAATKP